MLYENCNANAGNRRKISSCNNILFKKPTSLLYTKLDCIVMHMYVFKNIRKDSICVR